MDEQLLLQLMERLFIVNRISLVWRGWCGAIFWNFYYIRVFYTVYWVYCECPKYLYYLSKPILWPLFRIKLNCLIFIINWNDKNVPVPCLFLLKKKKNCKHSKKNTLSQSPLIRCLVFLSLGIRNKTKPPILHQSIHIEAEESDSTFQFLGEICGGPTLWLITSHHTLVGCTVS